jgi:hypothetical protein
MNMYPLNMRIIHEAGGALLLRILTIPKWLSGTERGTGDGGD